MADYPRKRSYSLGSQVMDEDEGTTIRIRPSDAHFILVIGWLNPHSLENYWQKHLPFTTQESEIVMDVHIRQQVAFGDVVSIRGGISSGEEIITRSSNLPLVNRR